IHPYARMAWSILAAAIIAQINQDQSIKALLETMLDCHNFVDEAEPLKHLRSAVQVLSAMAKQTTECAYFIRDFTRVERFWVRTVTNRFVDIDGTITRYQVNLRQLQDQFTRFSALRTEISTSRIELSVNRILDFVDIARDIVWERHLRELPYASAAGWNRRKACLPGTRTELLDEIIAWINDDCDPRRVCLLLGEAGTGKSAVAHTIAQLFRDLARLASIFCFDRSFKDRTPLLLFPTVARDLADCDPAIKKALLDSISECRSDLETPDIATQFERFILGPAGRLMISGPIVIVIDALDESEAIGEDARDALLSVLATNASRLPPNIRIVVTSRPEEDVERVLGKDELVFCKRMADVPSSTTHRDIAAYIQDRLSALRPQFVDFDAVCRQLSDRSEGFFQWASTICAALTDRNLTGLRGDERLREVMPDDNGPRKSGKHLLDDVYMHILGSIFKLPHPSARERYLRVMAHVLGAAEPLSVNSLSDLLQGSLTKGDIQLILTPMGSLLSGVHSDEQPIKPLHTSFRDFLLDASRSGSFHIDLAASDHTFAVGALELLRKNLKFNICDFPTSYATNIEVPDLPERRAARITPSLSYACRYWALHATGADLEHRLIVLVTTMLSLQALFWLEALSLLNAMESLSYYSDFINRISTLRVRRHVSKSVELIIYHVQRFIQEFGTVIAQSAPHIYLSAFTFSPPEFMQHARHKFLGLPTIVTGGEAHWPVWKCTMEVPGAAVCAIRFSPDGRRIVSGNADGTVRVWDTDTGRAIGTPSKGHISGVNSVAYSSDGARIVSSSEDGSVRMWDARTLQLIGHPMIRHDGSVNSVAFSPCDEYIASASDDTTVLLWNSSTCTTIGEPLTGHMSYVLSVVFSPDGSLIASSSADETIRIWDFHTCHMVIGPLSDHSGWVRSIAFSPDGRRLVSGSGDATIRIWDVCTGHAIGQPIRAHREYVTAVAFSADGTRIVSGGDDNNVCQWDSRTLKQLGRPLSGHSDWVRLQRWELRSRQPLGESFGVHDKDVRCICISPDGTRIATGSMDKTIRIWYSHSGRAVSDPLTGHNEAVLGIAYAPDGGRIVSGSADHTLRIWDHRSGGHIGITTLEGHLGSVRAVAFSPDGNHIVSCSTDRTLRLWDAHSGEPIDEPWTGHRGAVHCIAFSPDGVLVASGGSGDGSVCLWNARSGKPLAGALKAHLNVVHSVAFSPNGSRLVSGSKDGTIRVWDVRSICLMAGYHGVAGDNDAGPAIHLSPSPAHALQRTDEFIASDMAEPSDANPVRMEDGWLVGPRGERLLWVPVHHRGKLWPPFQTLMIPTRAAFSHHPTTIDLSRLAHGVRWKECYNPEEEEGK
ncbi:WD40 repeat-like protein, partial [Punctularia strigosozonata HHB-11173 SS5]